MQTQGYCIRLVMASVLSVALLSLLLLPLSSAAQLGGSYDLVWFAITSGGSAASGGAYQLGSTLGQLEAGALSGGGYTLYGGFWGGADVLHHVYLPIVLR